MDNLLVEYKDDSNVVLNGEVKPSDEALDIMTSLGLSSTEAFKLLRSARQGKPVIVNV